MTTPGNQNPDPTAGKPPRRRWVPVSLRLFAAILVLLGVGSVLWIGVPAYRQHLALAELVRVKAGTHIFPRGPAWLRHRMGDERMRAFDEVRAVDLHEVTEPDESLGHVRSLPDLRTVNLNGTSVTDEGLARIRNLRDLQLWLCNTTVTDASLARLKRLTRLRWLLLDGTQVTDAGLKHLNGLNNLEWLGLADTNVTAEGVAELQRALPHLKIYRELIAHPRSGDRYLSTSTIIALGAGGIPGMGQIIKFKSKGVLYDSRHTTTDAGGNWTSRHETGAPWPAGDFRLEYEGIWRNRSARLLVIVHDPRHGTFVQNQVAKKNPIRSIMNGPNGLPMVRLPDTQITHGDGSASATPENELIVKRVDATSATANVEAGKPFEVAGRIRAVERPLGGHPPIVVQVVEVIKESTGTQFDLIVSEDFVQPSKFALSFEFRQTMIAPLPPGHYLVRAIYWGKSLCETGIEVKESESGESSNHRTD